MEKGTFKQGQISVTKGQQKKHVSQMTDKEIRLLSLVIKSLNINETVLSRHVCDKFDSSDLSFSWEQAERTFRSHKLVEYNQTGISSRVLIRGKRTESILVDGVVVPSNLCLVLDIKKNRVVTAYWNAAVDNHQRIDMRRYNADMVIAV